MSGAASWVEPVLYGLSGLAGLVSGSLSDDPEIWWPRADDSRNWWILAAFVIFVIAAAVGVARESKAAAERSEQTDWIKNAETEHKEAIQNLLGNQLHNLIHLVAEPLTTRDAQMRKTQSAQARVSIICAAAAMVGRSAGTRANLFRLSDDRAKMEREPNGFSGRGDQSNREFHVGDETFDKVLDNRVRWVPSVAASAALQAQNLRYETFLVHPVSIGQGHVYGALTVDCLKEGDLDYDVDVPMMAVLSTLIAMTYECEKYPNPRK